MKDLFEKTLTNLLIVSENREGLLDLLEKKIERDFPEANVVFNYVDLDGLDIVEIVDLPEEPKKDLIKIVDMITDWAKQNEVTLATNPEYIKAFDGFIPNVGKDKIFETDMNYIKKP